MRAQVLREASPHLDEEMCALEIYIPYDSFLIIDHMDIAGQTLYNSQHIEMYL